MAWIKKAALAIAALVGAILAFIFLGGRSKTGEADATALKAQQAREKADLIDEKIAALKEEARLTDEAIAKERERISKLDDLEEIANEFDKLNQ